MFCCRCCKKKTPKAGSETKDQASSAVVPAILLSRSRATANAETPNGVSATTSLDITAKETAEKNEHPDTTAGFDQRERSRSSIYSESYLSLATRQFSVFTARLEDYEKLEKEQKVNQILREKRLELIQLRLNAEEIQNMEAEAKRAKLVERYRKDRTPDASSKLAKASNNEQPLAPEQDSPEVVEIVETFRKIKALIVEKMIGQKPLMFLNDIQILCDISTGKFSRLMYSIMVNPDYTTECVIKVKEKDARVWPLVKKEVMTLERVAFTKNPFVVQVISLLQTKGHLCSVVEYMEGNSLKIHFQLQKVFSEWKALFYSSCVLEALSFIHQRRVVHRSVIMENIFLDKDGYAKLSGFDSAEILTVDLAEYDRLGVKNFEKSLIDFRQLGQLVHTMLSGVPMATFPFPKISKRLSAKVDETIRIIFAMKARDFMSAADVKELPFFKLMNWSNLTQRSIQAPYYQRLSMPERSPEYIFDTLENTELVKDAPYGRFFDRGDLWKIE